MDNNINLTIRAYKDDICQEQVGENFIVPINPENFSIKSEVKYHPPSVFPCLNILKYSGYLPELLTFSLQFNENINIDVNEKVKEFKNVVYHNVNKKNNAPNYIRVTWGETDFRGRLVNLDLSYSTFERNGKLKSAKANISISGKSFENDPPSSKQSSVGSSPNMTNLSHSSSSPKESQLSISEKSFENALPSSKQSSVGSSPNMTNLSHSSSSSKESQLLESSVSVNKGKVDSESYPPKTWKKISKNAKNTAIGTGLFIASNTSFSDGTLKVFGTKIVSFEGFDIKAGNITGANITGFDAPTDVNIVGGLGGNSPTTIINNNVYNQAPAGAYDGGPDRIYSGVDNSSSDSSISDSNASNLSGSNNSFSSRNSLRTPKTSSVSVLTDIPTPKISPWQRLALMTKKVCAKGYHAAKKAVS